MSNVFMSLVFAAIAPHPPMLIPAIGKEQMEKLSATKKAMEQLEQDLYVARPHVIIVISPHGSLYDNAFTVNAHTHFISAFEQFGDLATKQSWRGAPEVAADIAHKGRKQGIPAQLVSAEQVDHGVSVPLSYLANHLPEMEVLPVGYSCLSREDHAAFGRLLYDVIVERNRRAAVVASADLSHCLTEDAPEARRARGRAFDAAIRERLENGDFAALRDLDEDTIEGAQSCGWRAILILLGLLGDARPAWKTYAYEAPFGVGYLTGNFAL